MKEKDIFLMRQNLRDFGVNNVDALNDHEVVTFWNGLCSTEPTIGIDRDGVKIYPKESPGYAPGPGAVGE